MIKRNYCNLLVQHKDVENSARSVSVRAFHNEKTWKAFHGQLSDHQKKWLAIEGFDGRGIKCCFLPDAENNTVELLVSIDPDRVWSSWCKIFDRLPAHYYYFKKPSIQGLISEDELAMIWALHNYRDHRYLAKRKPKGRTRARFILDRGETSHTQKVRDLVESIYLGRDLINTPANDLLPHQFEEAVRHEFEDIKDVEVTSIVGDDLLAQNYPLIHVVGRASVSAPRLVRIRRKRANAPKLALVGKGICFDTGGLNIKPDRAMQNMKKDMGGAAHALSLAKYILLRDLPVDLDVYIPMAENAINGNAFRPGDVYVARNGTSVEIVNTDAEGRLVLADALSAASEGKPDLLIDFATLTGAARVAVGTELPAFFSTDKNKYKMLEVLEGANDPAWELPLYSPYLNMLKSEIADIMHASNIPFAGATTAALFLQKFVHRNIPWCHFDTYGWNFRHKSTRPKGGEVFAVRGLVDYLENHWIDQASKKSKGKK